MSSELRLRANRANAAHSTGPVTSEGKAHSSRNSLRPGFLAKQILVGNESSAAFKAVFNLFCVNVDFLRQAGIRNEANNFFASNKNIEINSSKIADFGPKRAVSARKTSVFTPKKRAPALLPPPGIEPESRI